MSYLLWEYQRPEPATWVYLSSLLTIALYFVFHRFWSIRNLDLILLVLLGPGLYLVYRGQHSEVPPQSPAEKQVSETNSAIEPAPIRPHTVSERVGFHWLFAVGLLFLVRLLLDPVMVRRPLLDPNLSTGGLAFLVCALLVFMLSNVMTGIPVEQVMIQRGPGYPFLESLPNLETVPELGAESPPASGIVIASRIIAVVANLLLITGILLVGHRHFNNIKAGLGAAVLYLLSPYSALMTGYVDHVVPGTLLVWAILMYRRPAIAGMLLGIGAGLVYYPLFLLPLWISFYWQRGLRRFGVGVVFTLCVMAGLLALDSENVFGERIQQMFGLILPVKQGLEGIWGLGWNPNYRIPVITGFMILACSFAFWPGQKNLGTLLSCSAALMVAAQFWHGFGGGLFIAWYLPLLLLTVFRPNLEDRIALKVIGGRWSRSIEKVAPSKVEAA